MQDDSKHSPNSEKRYRTLADIARALQLDASTISLVLSGSKKPSEKTRKRVLSFCQKVNFRPNLLAQGLSKGRSGLVGVLLPDVQSSFFPGILEGIENVSNEYNYTSFLALSRYDPELMRSQIMAMQARYVEGLLIVPTGQPGEREILMPVLDEVAHVFLCMPMEDEPLDTCVRVDDELGGFVGTEHLIKLGHKRIGMLSGPARMASAIQRRAGYQRALQTNGFTVEHELMAPTGFDSRSGYDGMRRLLKLEKPPTAIMAISDYAALGAIEALLEAGLRPGEDVAVVGYDDICCGQHSPVPLTTVRQPQEELGEASARALVEILAGNTPVLPLLKPEIVVRRSCGAWKRQNVIELSSSAERLTSK